MRARDTNSLMHISTNYACIFKLKFRSPGHIHIIAHLMVIWLDSDCKIVINRLQVPHYIDQITSFLRE